MNLQIRMADLQRDRQSLIDLFREFLTPHSDSRRFAWLYEENPSGKALAWVAEDTDEEKIVGAAAVFPRKLLIRGKTHVGYVLGDFCIHPGYRSMGPALQLQRACLERVHSEPPGVGYDFPSESMLAVYRRLKVEPQDQMMRLAKPLRVDRQVARRMKGTLLARGISAIGNRALAWRDRHLNSWGSAEFALHMGSCGEEFSSLAAQVSAENESCVARSAEHLNWRFLAHPIRRFEILTARRNRALAGFLVFSQDRENASIVDLIGIDDATLLGDLVAVAVELLRDRGVFTVSAPMLASHPRVNLFKSLGFQERDSCPVVFYPPTAYSGGSDAGHTAGWFLMDGDRDS